MLRRGSQDRSEPRRRLEQQGERPLRPGEVRRGPHLLREGGVDRSRFFERLVQPGRRLRQHRQTNPSITVGPTIELPLDQCTVDLEHWIHRMMREWFDSPYKEHYRLPTEDWIEFMEGGFFQEVSESIS